MSTQTLQAEAETVELARANLKTQIPDGWFIQSEEILSTGKIQISRGTAETYAEAAVKAEANVPHDSRPLETKEVQKAETWTLTVEAETQAAAQGLVKGKLAKTEVVKSVELAVPGKKGFLGIGKTLDQYKAVIVRQSIVEITHKKTALLRVVVGDQVATWEGLLAVLRSAPESSQAKQLFEQFPYHVLFVVVSNRIGDASYFSRIPFGPVTPAMIAGAKHYVENPSTGLLGAFGGGLDPDRYVVKPDGKVYRKANLVTDAAIVSVADCLTGRGQVSLNDPAGAARFAFDAIMHYAELPAAAFLFALPYLETVVTSKKVDLQQTQATQYKGVEGLLVELYNDLGEGGLISDRMVLDKVDSLLRA